MPYKPENNYVVGATSMDNGETWTEKMIVDPKWGDAPRAFDPQMWLDPNGKLWFFWNETPRTGTRDTHVWATTTENPGDENPDWSEPRMITRGLMACKPTVLSSGEWVLTSSFDPKNMGVPPKNLIQWEYEIQNR